MRVLRAVLGGCVGVVATVVVLATLTSTPPTPPAIKDIVSHKLKEELEGKMTCDRKLLVRLGLSQEESGGEEEVEEVEEEESSGGGGVVEKSGRKVGTVLYPHHTWDNLSTPVLASAVWGSEVGEVEGLVGVVQQTLPNLTLVVYTLDLSPSQLHQVEDACNSTTSSCLTLPFNFTPYPAHVRDPRLKAYRPIIIQELLVRAGAVLWLDSSVRLVGVGGGGGVGVSGGGAEGWGDLALRGGGVLTWPLPAPAPLPSAALTHPNMFAFFHTKKHNYDFQQMGDAGTVLVYNTPGVHQHLMLPWVSCALTHNCISPIGAQDTGCRYDKKPLFRYSGCHHYDASAFNVALGVMYGYDTRPYLAPASPFTRSPPPTPQQEEGGEGGERAGEENGISGEVKTEGSLMASNDHIKVSDVIVMGDNRIDMMNREIQVQGNGIGMVKAKIQVQEDRGVGSKLGRSRRRGVELVNADATISEPTRKTRTSVNTTSQVSLSRDAVQRGSETH